MINQNITSEKRQIIKQFIIQLLSIYLLFSPIYLLANEKVTLQLKWFHQFQFAGYYAAKEKGFYLDEGLDVKIKERDISLNNIQQIIDGKAEYGIADSSLFLYKSNNKPVVIVSSIFQHSPNVLISLKSNGIDSPYDLDNKNVLFYNNDSDGFSLFAMMRKLNVKPNIIRKREKNDYLKLVSEEVDLLPAYLTNEPFYFKKMNIKINIINPINYGIDLYGDMIFTNKNEVTNHPKRVEKFKRASLRGWEYALNNKEEIIQLIHKKYYSSKSIEHLRYEADAIERIINKQAIPLGTTDKGRIKYIYNLYQEYGLLKNDLDIGDFIFEEYQQNQPKIKLTKDEAIYLKNKKQISMCIDPDWMPYEMNDNGKHTGMASDYINLLEKNIGFQIKLVNTTSWNQTLTFAKERKCDIISLAAITEDRKLYLDFTKSYLKVPLILVTNSEELFIDDISKIDKEIGIVKGYAYKALIESKYPKIKLKEVTSLIEGFNQVKNKQLFGFIETLATTGFYINKEHLTEIKIAAKFDELLELGVATRNDEPHLKNIFNKAIDSISKEQRQQILDRWMAINYEQKMDYVLIVKWIAGIIFVFSIILFIILRVNRKLNSEILKRKETEVKLKKYIDEIKISSFVFKDTIDAILISDENGSILRINDAFTRLTGYSLDEVIGKNPNILKSGEHDTKFYEKLWNSVLTQGSWTGEIQNIKKNGERFISFQSISAIRDENGNVKYMTSVLHDITEQKKYEKQIEGFNKDLQEKVENRTNDLTKKTNKITDLLNNAAQGFLSFEKDFLIDDEYSLECEYLLGKDLKNKDITEFLFGNKIDKISFFKETIIDVLKEENELTSSLLLSLLVSEIIINKRAVLIDYKKLSDNKIMMILTNITDKKKLQTKLKKEQSILKMIVTIVSDSIQFYETKENFEEFCKDSILYINSKHTPKENTNTLSASLHTFKGLFAQLYMKNSVKKLHEFESKLSDFSEKKKNNNDLIKLIESLDLITCMNEDLEIITDTLGDKFLKEHSYIKIDENLINKLEDKILSISLLDTDQKHECEEILYDIKKIKNKSLHYHLSIYQKLCYQLCLSLNKSIYPFEISGESNIFVPDNFKPFINSLVHVFRNACDHGLETKEIRVALNKDEKGKISCAFKKTKKNLCIEISDDGKGIDINSLKDKILETKLSTKEKLDVLSKDEMLNFIFDSNFTTNVSVTQISGRGIGLSSVKLELEKLNGTVLIKTEVNEGTSFIFKLPLSNDLSKVRNGHSFDVFEDLIIHTNLDSKIIYANKSYLMFVQKDLDEVLQKKDSELVKLTNISNHQEDMDKLVQDETPLIYDEVIEHNANIHHYKTKKELSLDNNTNDKIVKITRRDISSYKRYHDLYTKHKILLKYIAEGESLEFILNEIIKSVESRNQNMICSILILDKSKQKLKIGAAPSLPGYYNNAIDGMHIGKEVGSCGAAAYLKQRVIVEDISTHKNWQFAKELAFKTNLHACWSQPLFSSGNEVLGTFAIYYNKPKKPNEFDIFLIEEIAIITAIAVEKYKNQLNEDKEISEE